jgi:hypothetical protein
MGSSGRNRHRPGASCPNLIRIMTECRSQGGVPASIVCGFIDGAVFAYLDNHPAANTKAPGDLEANVARNFRIGSPLSPLCKPDQMKVEINSPGFSLYLTSAIDTLSAGLGSLNGVARPRNFTA